MKIELIRGDITKENVDAIVNAANRSLLGGGGVDGAIHRAAGPQLLAECKQLRRRLPDGLLTGSAVSTGAGDLPCKWVIHTVGPIYKLSDNPAADLENCYISCLEEADNVGAKSVSFPAISCGAFGYPLLEAAPIALRVVISSHTKVELVRFVLFDDALLDVFRTVFTALKVAGLSSD